MTTSEILDDTLTWWNGRVTMNNKGVYTAFLHAYDNKDMEVVVKTPWDTYHTAIRIVWGGYWISTPSYSCWQSMQYHFTGWLPLKELDKQKIYNMMRKQRRILETSLTL